jgi:hypothetical protein
MKKMMRGLAAGAALALASVSGGCANAYGYDGGGWGGSTEMRGTVTAVHDRYNVIRLRRDNGRVSDVRYDSRTEVVSSGRRYRPESLDRGDYVSMRVDRDSRGQLYTRHVTVRREARGTYSRDRDRRDDRWDDRRDRDGRNDDRRGDRGWYDVRSVDGRVGRVDRGARRFELRSDRGTVWVTLPSNADRGVRERFQRLRTGDHVHVSGRYEGSGRFRMDRFR